jgi:lipopolysaccharide/colanic/teichoic acid biosynthesis glycosyltransferase
MNAPDLAASAAPLPLISRLRFQIGGGLIFAVLLPYLIYALFSGSSAITITHYYPMIGGFIGLVLGTWWQRGLTNFPGVEESANIVTCFALSFGLVAATFLFGRFDYSRAMLLSIFVLTILWVYILYFFSQRRRVLTIGVIPIGETSGLQVIDRVNWQQLNNPDQLIHGLDAVTVDLRSDIPDEWDRRVADFALAGIPVYHVKHLQESLTGRVELQHLSENAFGALGPPAAWLKLKQLFDQITALVGLIVLAIPLLLVGFAVRLDSPGPIIFRQARTGYRGTPFWVFKFRTMRVDASDVGSALHKAMTQDGDPRITRLGRHLRRLRIDELPQMINILFGEMSWIGPRPEASVLSEHYEAQIPFYRYRHVVYPGISGWAQVNQGHVTGVDDVQEKLHYDFYYIKHFSPWIDVLIFARTIRTVLTGFGSK